MELINFKNYHKIMLQCISTLTYITCSKICNLILRDTKALQFTLKKKTQKTKKKQTNNFMLQRLRNKQTNSIDYCK